MAEEEMKILITAVDDTTKTLKGIEDTLTKTSKNVERTTESTSKAFTEQTGNLLVLGNAVDRVDRVFSSYQNMQIRVENATERLANAQDRLKKAQLNLQKVQKSSTSTTEDLAEAQQELTAASRGLTISQNNLARVNNQVFGTYVQMATGVGQLAASMPNLIASTRSLTTASLAFVATPVGATLATLAGTLAVVAAGYKVYSGHLERMKDIEEKAKDNAISISDAYRELYDNTKRTTEALKELQGLLTGEYTPQSEKEAQALVKIAEKEKEIADLRALNKRPAGTSQKIIDAEAELEKMKTVYDAEFAKARDVFDAKINLQNIQEMSSTQSQQRINDFWNKSYQDQLTYLKDKYYVELRRIKDEDWKKDMENYKALMKAQYDLNAAKMNEKYSTSAQFTRAVKSWFGFGDTTRVNDAIITKKGQIIETSPDDNIMAFKGNSPGGAGINVSIGNVYGMNPNDIAKALQKELVRKGVY
jgi:hypothetical protein